MFAREGESASGGIVFWGVLFGLFAALVFAWYAPTFQAQFGLPLVDIEGGFDIARTVQLIADYGPQGRQAYLGFLTLDCLFPVAFSLLLIATFRVISRPLSTRVQRRVVLLAALPAVCDLVENTLHALLVVLFPRLQQPLATLASAATAGKYASLGVALVTLGVVAWLWLRQQRPAAGAR